MATPSRHADHSIAEEPPIAPRLLKEPQAFELLQALLMIERAYPQAARWGQSITAKHETIWLRGPLEPIFSPSQIESIKKFELIPNPDQPEPLKKNQWMLKTPVFGLGGPDGPLPYAYQEWLQHCARNKKQAPAAFLDIFQHRLLSLLTRVLRKHRLAIGFEPPQHSAVHKQLRSLIGLANQPQKPDRAIADSALLANSALFMGSRRSLAGFRTLFKQYFGHTLSTQAYEGAWRSIPSASLSKLGRNGSNLCLGRTAIAGRNVWDEHAGINLTIGPLSAEDSGEYLPPAAQHKKLASLAGFYFGPELKCSLTLLVAGAEPLRLKHSNGPHLSWHSLLCREPSSEHYTIHTQLMPAEEAPAWS